MNIPDDNPHKKRAEQMLKYAKKLIRDRTNRSDAEKDMAGAETRYPRTQARGILLTSDPALYEVGSNVSPEPSPATAVVHIAPPQRKA